ncbi:MAG: geranylgeranylglycerol-phosphate geranylgeranyltransferase [Candidatus Krumholzibacteria bacterium]|nr:geranylgeranylglycerol-phosphate geranylgeranyltransferase [Candidatus Krumholzibacteria bacterium]
MHILVALICITRPHNIAAATLSILVGYRMTLAAGFPWWLLAGVVAATAAGNVINDIQDRDIDRINKPRRPIPSGALSVPAAWSVYGVCVLLSLLIGVRLPLEQGLWIVSWIILLHLYSARLKRVYLAGNLLVALISSSGFLLGALAAGRISTGLIPAVYTFLFVMGRELVKDTEDCGGDRAHGARTVPIVHGERFALRASALIFALLAVTFPLPSLIGLYSLLYGVIMVCSVVPILVLSVYLVLRSSRATLVSGLLKLGMFFGILAFYFGPIRG